MKRSLALGIVFLGCTLLASTAAWGQILYSQNFDVDDTPNWTVQTSVTDTASEL